MNERADHLSWRQVLDAVEGREDMNLVQGHLQGCEECRDELGAAGTLLGAFRFAADPGASEALRDRTWLRIQSIGRTGELAAALTRAIDEASADARRVASAPTISIADEVRRIFGQARTRLEDAAGRARETLQAALLVDSWFDNALAVRGSTAAFPRILVYETPDYTVSLSLHADGDPDDLRFDLMGQLTPKKGTSLPEGTRVRLGGHAVGETVTEASPFGEFRFERTAPDGARLTIEVGGQTIEVGPLPQMGVA